MFDTQASSLNELVANLVIEEFSRLGVSKFFISPGSRSTPLVLAVAEKNEPEIIIDERAAAFAALGFARANENPPVLVCTSGTAAANYYPAIIEAFYDEIPLIVLTADRPTELHRVKANQTIDQQRLYGKHTKYFANLLPPDVNQPVELYLAEINRAVKKTMSKPNGPVHLNFMFREPLSPTDKKTDHSLYCSKISSWLNSAAPFLDDSITEKNLTQRDIQNIADILNEKNDGMIIYGADFKKEGYDDIFKLAQKLKWPILPDIRSGMRTGIDNDLAVPFYDQILLEHPLDISDLTILHLGGNIVSKRLITFIENSNIENYINITTSDIPFNPHHKLTKHLKGDISQSCQPITELVMEKSDQTCLYKWQSKNRIVNDTLNDYFKNSDLTEISVPRIISENISGNSALFLGSSMPIRDFDMYARHSALQIDIAANRGVSGIDGALASFYGFVIARSKPGTAIIGDLSFLHDLNSLALFKNITVPATIIVINNNGGGIFSFLPVAERLDRFEPYFGTPHNMTFQKAAEQFDLEYFNPTTKEQLIEIYKKSQRTNHAALIEITSDRKANFKHHQILQQRITDNLKQSKRS